MLVNDYTSGGWLARAALGDGSWNVEGESYAKEARAADRVRALITVAEELSIFPEMLLATDAKNALVRVNKYWE